MLSENDELNITPEARDYINSYPAFSLCTKGERIFDPFFNGYIGDRIIEINISLAEDNSVPQELEPLAEYCYMIWHYNNHMMDMEKAEKLLRWMEPLWCEYKNIDSSGFFHDESVTLDDEEDFVV